MASPYNQPGPVRGLWGSLPHPIIDTVGGFINAQTGGLVAPQRATAAQLNEAYGRFLQAGFSDGEARYLLDQVASEVNPKGTVPYESVMETLQQRELEASRLGEVDQAYKPTIDRLERIEKDPNAVRGDYEYGAQLGDLENRINAAVEAAKINQRQAMATGGGGPMASGLGSALVQQAESQRSFDLGKAYSGVLSDARTRLDSLRTGYRTDRSNILSGRDTSFTDPYYGTGVGVKTAGHGLQTELLDRGLNLTSAILGGAQNAAQGAASNVLGGLQMIRK